MKYIAQTDLSDRSGRVIARAGRPVPREVIRFSPWLVERGYVRAEPAPTSEEEAR